DGTLLDSTKLHFQGWKYVLELHGLKKTKQEILNEFGKNPLEIANKLFNSHLQYNNQKIEQIAEEKAKFVAQNVNRIPIYPEVPQILQKLHKNGIPFVLASNGARIVVEAMIQNFNFLQISQGFICVEDVEHEKPNPEMMLRAKNILNLPASQIAVIGDSTFDILAGKAAQMKTIAICTKHKKEEFQEIETEVILQEFREIRPYFNLL
ncbi:MAG: HAD family hydrolase, partial [Promethearchaeota archaeon]